MRISNKQWVSMVSTLLLASTAGAASMTAYTDLGSFTAAAGSLVVEDFSDTTLQTGLSIQFGTNIPAGSISGGEYHDVSVTSFSSTNPLVTFSTPVKAFGADWDLTPGGNGGGLLLSISFADATTSSLVVPYDSSTIFRGFVSDTNVTSIRIHAADFTGEETFDADNFRFSGTTNGGGGGPAVPEPSAALVFSAGMLLVRKATKRR